MIEGSKVVSSDEMARVEKASIAAGASGAVYMETAGRGIAECIDATEVTLLVGKGNNGGDAFVAGCHLLQRGASVRAVHPFSESECSPLCREHRQRFIALGGMVTEKLEFRGVILDGLLGTGFHGAAEGIFREAIEAVNASDCPVIAIDIPSGLDGNTGDGEAIRAERTLYLGMPKVGCFLKKGFGYVGEIDGVDFGLPASYVDEMKASAYLLNESAVEALAPPIERTRHKYETGYVVALAGSPGMGGAAELSTLASLRTGAGIVRLFHPPEMEEEMIAAFPELIRSHWTPTDTAKLFAECQRARALLIGPGLGEGHQEIVRRLLATGLPAVVDADGLKVFQEGVETHGPLVLTPHRGEMKALVGAVSSLEEAAERFANENNATLVLKGSPTWIFSPGTKPLISLRGDPGMATAGAGDVLTGVIAALLAQGLAPREAAALGAHVHGIAGEEAARHLSSYSLIASDLIEHLPDVMRSLQ